MRQIILDELKRQNINIARYAFREELKTRDFRIMGK